MIVVVACAPRIALPDAATSLAATIDGDCPDRPSMLAALALALPDLAIDDRAATQLHVTDLGGRYRVSVAGQQREFIDEVHDCELRARTATAVALLALRPPTLPPPLPHSRLEPPRGGARPGARAELTLSGALDGAPRSGGDNGLLSGGAALRASVHWGRIGLVVVHPGGQPTLQTGSVDPDQ